MFDYDVGEGYTIQQDVILNEAQIVSQFYMDSACNCLKTIGVILNPSFIGVKNPRS